MFYPLTHVVVLSLKLVIRNRTFRTRDSRPLTEGLHMPITGRSGTHWKVAGSGLGKLTSEEAFLGGTNNYDGYIYMLSEVLVIRTHGATVARSTPDRKVVCSNRR